MRLAFLDIETSWQKSITVIGVYIAGEGTQQLVAPNIACSGLAEVLEGIDRLFTYNGARFDLPVIAAHLGMDLTTRHSHRDLMYDCWKANLKGGLKAVERQLGIHRDTDGIDGLAAMNLWSAHERGHSDALELLLRYNREDVENLEILARKLQVL